MAGTYDLWLVLLSVIVAVNASFVALDLAARVVASKGQRVEWRWIVGGAISMGTGIWSMHFIGMLAFRLPIPISYEISTHCCRCWSQCWHRALRSSSPVAMRWLT